MTARLRRGASLESTVEGVVLRPGVAAYDEARRLFNAAIDNQPVAIAQVADAEDVVNTVRFAADRGLSLSVRGGGHGVAGLATAGEIVVDLNRLRRVEIDVERRLAHVEGGATWKDIDAASQAYGLATPGGRVTTTGVGGLTLGGGQGWLSPLHGLASDNLASAEVVTADGELLATSEEENPDLLWGLRGGGGGLGVVTRLTFRLHPVGPMVLAGNILYPFDQAAEVSVAAAAFLDQAPREVSGALVYTSAPPLTGIPPELVGQPIVSLTLCWFGSDLELGERTLAPARRLGTPLVDLVGPMSYCELQAMTDSGHPFGNRHYWSAGYFDELHPEVVAQTITAIAHRLAPSVKVIVAPLGAAVQDHEPASSAFPHRAARWFFHPLAAYQVAADDDAQKAWVKGLMSDVRPHQRGGSFLNYVSAQDNTELRASFGDPTFDRLTALRSLYDPRGSFVTTTARAPNPAHVKPTDHPKGAR